MTDRIDHRAAAEGELTDAREWGRQAEEPTPEVGELTCLAYSAVHALLAIHDTLTAADRYAANEARQREAGADLLALDEAECSCCGTTYPSTAEATMEHHRACTGETPENPMGDPLDEDDHRDRLDRDGDVWVRYGQEHWHFPDDDDEPCPSPALCDTSLRSLDAEFGPLTFAPDAAQDATGGDLSAPEGESGAEERGEADNTVEPLLCPKCGNGIDDHPVWDGVRFRLRCRLTAAEVARALIEQAVKAERTRLAMSAVDWVLEQAGGGRG